MSRVSMTEYLVMEKSARKALEKLNNFRYLGAVSAEWGHWNKCNGVLCDRNMSVKLHDRIFRAVAWPALVYDAEKQRKVKKGAWR